MSAICPSANMFLKVSERKLPTVRLKGTALVNNMTEWSCCSALRLWLDRERTCSTLFMKQVLPRLDRPRRPKGRSCPLWMILGPSCCKLTPAISGQAQSISFGCSICSQRAVGLEDIMWSTSARALKANVFTNRDAKGAISPCPNYSSLGAYRSDVKMDGSLRNWGLLAQAG